MVENTHTVAQEHHVVSFTLFWKIMGVIVPALLAVSWYLAFFYSEYCMLQVTNTEDRIGRVSARQGDRNKLFELRLLTLEAGSGPADPAVIQAIKSGVEALSNPAEPTE